MNPIGAPPTPQLQNQPPVANAKGPQPPVAEAKGPQPQQLQQTPGTKPQDQLHLSPELAQDRKEPGHDVSNLVNTLDPHEPPPTEEEKQNPLRQGKSIKEARVDKAKDQEILDHVCGKGCGCGSTKKGSGDPLKALEERDTEVQKHELDHWHEAGEFAASGPQYETTTASNGRSFITGGKVMVNIGEIADDPEKTIAKMKKIESSSLKPAEPSDQDRRVAAQASQKRQKAEMELTEKRRKKEEEGGPQAA